MLIALDYDGVLTVGERDFWRHVINVAQHHGYDLVTVTSRNESEHNREEIHQNQRYLAHCTWPIVFAHDRPKRQAAEEAGYVVDIWVDDQPHMIGDGRGVLECQGVWENELRHAAEVLEQFHAGAAPASAIAALSLRLSTVVGATPI